jgi:hypothetical protein
MRKIRKFNGDDNSYVEGTASSLRDDTEDQLRQDQAERMARMARGERATDPESAQGKALAELTPAETESAAPAKTLTAPKPQNFKSAFAEARSAGEKTFEFGGKKYTTELAKKAAPKVRETTVEDVFPVLTGEKKRAEEKMDKKQFRAEQNAQIIAREGAKAKAKAKAKESETRTPKRAGNLTDMFDLSSRYASGGSVSSRADGIAQRGKTRGKMC